MRTCLTALIASAAIAACSDSPAANPDQPAVEDNADQSAAPAADKVAAARTALEAEPKVRGVTFDSPRWTVAVAGDGTRRDGLAETFCMVIGEQGAEVDATEVAIVDAVEADTGDGPLIGGVRCSSGERLYS